MHSLSTRDGQLNDIRMIKIARGCPNLSHINLSYCFKLTDVSLCIIGEVCSLLQEVNLARIENTTDLSIIAIAKGYCKLIRLDIDQNWNHNNKITDSSITFFPNRCPNLLNLHLSRSSSMSDVSLALIAENCPLLMSLEFVRRATDVGL